MTFTYTGAMQVFSVPADIQSSPVVAVYGAQGAIGADGAYGGGATAGGAAGLGAKVSGNYLIPAGGFDMNLFIGGSGAVPGGGFNGGGGLLGGGGGGGAGGSNLAARSTAPSRSKACRPATARSSSATTRAT